MNIYVKILITIFVIILVVIILLFGVYEYVRKYNTLQEFKNVDTKRASFSLSTTPSRFENIEPNIISLIAQNPKTIYLNVPYVFKKTGEEYTIPKWLNKYIENGSVILIRTEDKGPATKFLGLLDHYIDSDHYIVVLDDDQIYNKKMLSNLIYKADEVGGNSVISCMIDDGLITGYGGYIFKRKLLDNILNYEMPKECLYVDDVYITNYFKYHNIKMIRLFNMAVPNISIEQDFDNIISYFKSVFITNEYVPKDSYRNKVSNINPLYMDRGSKNNDCQIALNDVMLKK